MTFVFIGAAGALGCVVRFALSSWVQRLAGDTWPVGILVANVLGCFAFGLLYPLLAESSWRPEWKLAVLVGFLGGFTTFSTFAHEAVALGQEAPWRLALHVALHSGLGLIAVVAGAAAARACNG